MFTKLIVCNNVSGAGYTTLLWQLVRDKVIVLGPPQFTTRFLRPSEKHGEEYYSVPQEVLLVISNQIAIASSFGSTFYGYFLPAIHQIHRRLLTQNVIIYSTNLPFEWKTLMGPSVPIVSLFFAPSSPFICAQRIILRDFQDGNMFLEYLLKRVEFNKSYIALVECFDYWIDTTIAEMIFPAVKDFICAETTRSSLTMTRNVKRIPDNWYEISTLVQSFRNSSETLIQMLSKISKHPRNLSKEELLSKLSG